jgi:hypothetical protein
MILVNISIRGKNTVAVHETKEGFRQTFGESSLTGSRIPTTAGT